MIKNTSRLFPRKPVRANKNPITSFILDLVYSGLETFGKFYSIYLGKVEDNEDPERMGRLKLIIPDIAGNQVLDIWAFPGWNYGGQGYGIQLLPQKGDIVWVEFERGNAEKPIWRHSYMGLQEAPTDKKYIPTENIWLVTPNGTSILIDQKENRVEVFLPDGKKGIEIKDKAISLIHPSMISLGKIDKSDYSAVRGEILLDGIRDLQEGLKLLSESLAVDIATAVTAQLPFLRHNKMIKDVPASIAKLISAKDKLEKILSNKTTLE